MTIINLTDGATGEAIIDLRDAESRSAQYYGPPETDRARKMRQTKAVRTYLELLEELLEARKPRRGRKRSIESMKNQLEATNRKLASGDLDVIQRLIETQTRIDIENDIKTAEAAKAAMDGNDAELRRAEDAFVRVAKAYADRNNISKEAFRELGVPAAVLKRAGI